MVRMGGGEGGYEMVRMGGRRGGIQDGEKEGHKRQCVEASHTLVPKSRTIVTNIISIEPYWSTYCHIVTHNTCI